MQDRRKKDVRIPSTVRWFRESLVVDPAYDLSESVQSTPTAMLPDWAPNIHPLVIHFPIALLFTAALVDTVALFLRSNDFLRKGAFSLYMLGGLTVVAAFETTGLYHDRIRRPALQRTPKDTEANNSNT